MRGWGSHGQGFRYSKKSTEWEYKVLKTDLWRRLRLNSRSRKRNSQNLRENGVVEGESNIGEIMFRGSEFQHKGSHLHPFYLAIYSYNLGERSVSKLMRAEATFSGLKSVWGVER